MDEKLIAIIVSDEKKARECADALQDLHRNTSLTVYATAIMQREANGARIVERGPPGHVGVMLGSVLGLVIGALGGPAGMIGGLVAGGLIGGFAFADVSEDFVEEVVAKMRPGDFGVFAEILEEWTTPLDERVAQLGGTIIREMRRGYVEELLQRRVASDKAGLEDLVAQHTTGKARRMERYLEYEIASAARKLRDRGEKLNQRIDIAKEELDAKLYALEAQAAKASPEVRKRIERHISELRDDFDVRVKKLRSAYELTQEALAQPH